MWAACSSPQHSELPSLLQAKLSLNLLFAPHSASSFVSDEEVLVSPLVNRREFTIQTQIVGTVPSSDTARSCRQGAPGPQLVTRDSLKPVCGSAAQYLKQYQMVGINFLMQLARAGVGGTILADDMGLGKTCQLICFLGAPGHTFKGYVRSVCSWSSSTGAALPCLSWQIYSASSCLLHHGSHGLNPACHRSCTSAPAAIQQPCAGQQAEHVLHVAAALQLLRSDLDLLLL